MREMHIWRLRLLGDNGTKSWLGLRNKTGWLLMFDNMDNSEA